MTSRNTIRQTSFNIPSNRKLIKISGAMDAVIQYMELSSVYFIDDFKKENGIGKIDGKYLTEFRKKLTDLSAAYNIYLKDLPFDRFDDMRIKSYLVVVYGYFDEFADSFKVDVRKLINQKYIEIDKDKKGHGLSKLGKILCGLKNVGVDIKITPVRTKIFDYYRLIRNSLAHISQKDEDDINLLLSKIDMKEVAELYPKRPKIHKKDSLNFDDYIIAAANAKAVADELTRGLEKHIDWYGFIQEHLSDEFPKFKQNIENKERALKAITLKIRDTYGIDNLNNDIIWKIAH